MQAPPVVPLGPTFSEKVKIDDDVEVISVRSAGAKRARPRDQATVNVSKRARSSASTSHRSLSPHRDYPRGTSTVTRPLGMGDITGISVYCDSVKKQFVPRYVFATPVYRHFPETIVYFH